MKKKLSIKQENFTKLKNKTENKKTEVLNSLTPESEQKNLQQPMI